MKHLFVATLLLSPALASAQVSVQRSANAVTIGNAHLQRTFNLTDGGQVLRPGTLKNLRASSTFTPSAKSEEFALNLLTVKRVNGLLPQTGWTAVADGYTEENGCGRPQDAIDGNPSTYWHSDYQNAAKKAMPHYLLFDLQTAQTFQSFSYTGRSANVSDNGQMKEWELWAGNNAGSLSKVGSGTLTFSPEEQWVNLDQAVTARYVKLVIKSAQNNREFAAVGEFRLASQPQGNTNSLPAPLPRTGWTANATSWCVESATVGKPSLVLDGRPETLWHSWYTGQTQGTPNAMQLPHSLIISLGSETSFRSFGYQPRAGLLNGTIKGYKFEISSDSTQWTTVKEGEMSYEDASVRWIDLGQTYTAKFVRLTETSELKGNAFGSCAEFYLSAEEAKDADVSFKASQMRLANVEEADIADGKRVTFKMQPYTYTNPANNETSTWNISMVVEMKNEDHFLRKYLVIDGDAVARTTPIDFIEMERLGTENVPAANRWSHPEAAGGVGGMSGYTLTLGQPVYVEGMFFGSEFPQAENEISEGMAHTRYFSGKSLARLTGDGGAFTTWKNVEGATRSVTDLNVIRTDFFTYIRSIARPTQLRLQYNSWYDWMMRIDEGKINNSFKEMERGFSQYGIRPLDSYVVDDGWNNYSVSDTEKSGTTQNQTGFWEFNSKFPTGLQGASDIAKRIGSNFGIWLGPRGGYNFNGSWGKLLEASGKGTYNRNSNDAVTGDSVYIANLETFFLKCQREYGVNYWKLDGFSTVQPQPSTNNRYITGGKNGNYYFTEHWERWYKMFDKLYAEAAGRNALLWLNLTCYVNPSPWILQYCNSVWMQNSLDMSRQTVGGRSRELDKQLSYRDDRYYDFYNTNQLQFPMANIFNHDPIYGKENAFASNAMTPSEFRAYLYMMATRGTAFWEMLYSYTMMNETGKWMVNAEAINFIEKNYATLRNAIYHGATPVSGGVYGFSSWNKTDAETNGIISFRNPSNANKTYELVLDNRIGVPEDASGLWRSLVMEYSGSSSERMIDIQTNDDNTTAFAYGNTLSITLKPGEIRIWKFSTKKDETSAKIYHAEARLTTQVTVQFDEPVIATKEHFTLAKQDGSTGAPAVTNIRRKEDYRTYTLTLSAPLEDNTAYNVVANGMADWNGNVTNETSSPFFLNLDGTVLRIQKPEDVTIPAAITESGDFRTGKLMSAAQDVTATSEKKLVGNTPFALNFAIQTSNATGGLFQSGSDYGVSLESGKIAFTVGTQKVTSLDAINDNQRHFISCVREVNGMIKVYVDGELQASAYDGKVYFLQGGRLTMNGSNIAVGDVELRQDALSFSKISTASSENLGQHFVVTVMGNPDLNLTFTPHDGTTVENGNQLARFIAGKNAVVRANIVPSPNTTSYTVDGTPRSAAANASTVSVNFMNISADHTIDFSTLTGIQPISVTSGAGMQKVYDLQGRPAQPSTRGVYIIDGKKALK